MQHHDRAPVRLRLVSTGVLSLLVGGLALAAAQLPPQVQVPTTLQDFFQPGTQPGMLIQPIYESINCTGCHSGYDPNQEPYEHWSSSMMAQSSRDPIFWAGMAIANQDAAFAGEFCLRCHTPGAWLDGRSTPPDGSGLNQALGDFDGVTCHLCHRLVDPVYDANQNPRVDQRILQQVQQVSGLPVTPSNGQYIVDPTDTRRGPFDLGPNFFFHDWAESSYHLESQLCGTCHDVSNPAFLKQPDGTYALDTLNAPHPTQSKYDEFPIERTFSEWTQSAFAERPIDLQARFGGNYQTYSTCQQCHQPLVTGQACQPVLQPPVRNDLPQHNFNGVNSWVLLAVRALFPDVETGLTDQSVAEALGRTRSMQETALDLETWVNQGELRVRLVNQTGHKLPTGYSEGRRMWINVRFYDAGDVLLQERGAYDAGTAVLTPDTKVYEIEQGIDAAVAAATGLTAGPGFHFAINNVNYFDNRIPPRGFTNAGFLAVQAQPIGYAYAEEQYWDDTGFAIPPGAVRAEVDVWHQTTTKEYIEFLRDANTTNNAGQVAYNQWVAHGKSAPVLKDSRSIVLGAAPCVPPIRYGLAKQLSNGRYPGLAWSGAPSVSGPGFALVVRNGLPRSQGVVRSSPIQASVPFQGGRLLLGGPMSNVGYFQLDTTGQALVPFPMQPAMIGSQLNFQAFFRDRGVPGGQALTNALHVEFCP